MHNINNSKTQKDIYKSLGVIQSTFLIWKYRLRNFHIQTYIKNIDALFAW